jgi:hypothetical protein
MSTKFRPGNLTGRDIRVDGFSYCIAVCGLVNGTASFNILKLYILSTVYLYICIYLRTNPESSLTKRSVIGFHNRRGKCLLRSTNWVFK